jgi:predicted enzyme related to lactoylglutathione lyase
MCDDLNATLEKLAAAGASVSRPVTDEGWGLLAEVALPSGSTLSLYEPRHPLAYNLPPDEA